VRRYETHNFLAANPIHPIFTSPNLQLQVRSAGRGSEATSAHYGRNSIRVPLGTADQISSISPSVTAMHPSVQSISR